MITSGLPSQNLLSSKTIENYAENDARREKEFEENLEKEVRT